ncbi:hypothetical protein IWQ56_003353, partial [Coemansia nantahalensis]
GGRVLSGPQPQLHPPPRDGGEPDDSVPHHRRRDIQGLGLADLLRHRAVDKDARRILGLRRRDVHRRRLAADRLDGVVLPGRDAKVPVPALLAGRLLLARRVRLQHGGAPVQDHAHAAAV